MAKRIIKIRKYRRKDGTVVKSHIKKVSASKRKARSKKYTKGDASKRIKSLKKGYKGGGMARKEYSTSAFEKEQEEAEQEFESIAEKEKKEIGRQESPAKREAADDFLKALLADKSSSWPVTSKGYPKSFIVGPASKIDTIEKSSEKAKKQQEAITREQLRRKALNLDAKIGEIVKVMPDGTVKVEKVSAVAPVVIKKTKEEREAAKRLMESQREEKIETPQGSVFIPVVQAPKKEVSPTVRYLETVLEEVKKGPKNKEQELEITRLKEQIQDASITPSFGFLKERIKEISKEAPSTRNQMELRRLQGQLADLRLTKEVETRDSPKVAGPAQIEVSNQITAIDAKIKEISNLRPTKKNERQIKRLNKMKEAVKERYRRGN